MTALFTDRTGPGAVPDIEEYIATVIRQRTDMKPDERSIPATTPEKLAHSIRQSVLHRLGFADWNGPA